MASRTKYLFATVLISQIIVLLVYRLLSGQFDLSTTTRTIIGDTAQQHPTKHNSNSTYLFNNTIKVSLTTIFGENTQDRYRVTASVGMTTAGSTGSYHGEVDRHGAGGTGDLVKPDQEKQLTVDTDDDGLHANGTIPSGIFQRIDDKQAWLYSAFYDHVAAQKGRPLVRVFGVAKQDCLLKVYCTFSSEGRNLTSTGTLAELPDSHQMAYIASHLECKLPGGERPTHVSVSYQTSGISTNRLQIIYPGPRIRNFTVCYSVLYGGYNMTTRIIESIEVNRILGAEHFVVYNYSISPAVTQILHRYQDDGLVTVIPWPIPTLESWYFGQVLALSDCFYRNRNSSRFVVVVDTDEIIMPRDHSTWMELISSISPHESDISKFTNSSHTSNKKQTLTGCFMVRSSYFATDTTPNWTSLPSQFRFNEEERNNIIKHKIQTLSQFWRTETIFPPRMRTKYIARPDLVYNSGIHFARQFIYFMRCVNVDEHLALLHHYRRSNLKKNIVLDTSVLKLKQKLYPRIIEQIKRFPQIFT